MERSESWKYLPSRDGGGSGGDSGGGGDDDDDGDGCDVMMMVMVMIIMLTKLRLRWGRGKYFMRWRDIKSVSWIDAARSVVSKWLIMYRMGNKHPNAPSENNCTLAPFSRGYSAPLRSTVQSAYQSYRWMNHPIIRIKRTGHDMILMDGLECWSKDGRRRRYDAKQLVTICRLHSLHVFASPIKLFTRHPDGKFYDPKASLILCQFRWPLARKRQQIPIVNHNLDIDAPHFDPG